MPNSARTAAGRVPWRIWQPVIAYEWGSWLTIEARTVLVAHGRFTPGTASG